MFKKDRSDFESKWKDMQIIVEYGMLSDEKFYERSQDFSLYKTVDNSFYTINELKDTIEHNQKDKDGKTICLYTNNAEEQHMYVSKATERGYKVLVLDSPIVSHLIQKLESKTDKLSFVRVDSDSIDNLIKKDEKFESIISESDLKKTKRVLKLNCLKKNLSYHLKH